MTVARPTAVRPTRERTFPVEVLGPIVSSGVKQPYEFASLGIDTRDVRTLVRIASIAAQTEIVGFRLPAVLERDDVVDGKREENVLILANEAVLAAIARPVSDEVSQSDIHQAGRSLRSLRALDWRIAMKVPADTNASYSSRSESDSVPSSDFRARSSIRA
jgi:hypothetical protein